MSDVYGADDVGTPPVAILQPPVADPDRAAGFLSQHRERASRAEGQYDELMRQRQQAVTEARAQLDKTIEELRQRHSGGSGGVNLPLLSLAAGLLSPDPSGRVSNFGGELGRGLGAMGTTIRAQRMSDTDFLKGIAELQQRSAQMADVPLRDAAELAKRKQIQEEQGVAGLEKALITSKADRPFSLGSGILMDPKSNKIVNAFTGQEISLDPSKIVSQHGTPLMGSDVHGDEFLKSVPDPALRETIKSWGNYEALMPTMPRSPQALAYMNQMLGMVKQYNPDFDAKQYQTIQKGMKDWTGNGVMNQRAVSAATTAGHLANLQEAAATLNNTDFQKFNNVANWVASNKGDPRVQAFEAAKKAVMTEMSSFLGKGHPAEGQIREWEQTVANANSPQQLQAAMSQFAKIMHTQLETMASSKTRDLGGRKEFTPEDLIGKENAHVVGDVLKNDISTPGGRYAVMRRGQNQERKLTGEEPLPAPTAEQWQRGVDILKKAPTPENRAAFDKYYGPGSAKMVLGR